MEDFQRAELVVKGVFHWRIYSNELMFFLFEQQKLGLLVFQQRKVLLEHTYKQLGSGLSPQSCICFQVFGAES